MNLWVLNYFTTMNSWVLCDLPILNYWVMKHLVAQNSFCWYSLTSNWKYVAVKQMSRNFIKSSTYRKTLPLRIHHEPLLLHEPPVKNRCFTRCVIWQITTGSEFSTDMFQAILVAYITQTPYSCPSLPPVLLGGTVTPYEINLHRRLQCVIKYPNAAIFFSFLC